MSVWPPVSRLQSLILFVFKTTTHFCNQINISKISNYLILGIKLLVAYLKLPICGIEEKIQIQDFFFYFSEKEKQGGVVM